MNLVNELSSELALAFLVEKKYAEKVDTNDVLAIIGRVKEVLIRLSIDNPADKTMLPSAISAKVISH